MNGTTANSLSHRNSDMSAADVELVRKGAGHDDDYWDRVREVFTCFLPLGFITFGGPSAHIAILHERFVEKHKWMNNEQFLELMAVGQGLPGPGSTQMALAIGVFRGGMLGGFISLMLFQLPSFVIITLAGLGVKEFLAGGENPDWLKGAGPAAISLVFIAAYKLGGKVMGDNHVKYALGVTSAVITILINGDYHTSSKISAWLFPIMMFTGGLVALVDKRFRPQLYPGASKPRKSTGTVVEDPAAAEAGAAAMAAVAVQEPENAYRHIDITKWQGGVIVGIWLVVLLVSITLFQDTGLSGLFRSMYRIGSIIYGGGQVVLPMLLDEVVKPGWVDQANFLQGFALVQALPGPLFNFSAYLGAVYKGIGGAFVAYLALFGPGCMLIIGFLPFWEQVTKWMWFKTFLQGVNAAAIGLIIAACVLLWKTAISVYADAIVFVVAGGMQAFLGYQAPTCVIVGLLLGFFLSDTCLSLGQRPFCS